METWYSLRVTGFQPKFGKNAEARIVFADARSNDGTYIAYLKVTWEGRVVHVDKVTLVFVDYFPPTSHLESVIDKSDPAKTVIRFDIPENYAFLTLVFDPESYQWAIDLFGPSAAFDLFNTVCDWGVLEALHRNPDWYEIDRHFDLELDRLADHSFHEEDISFATNVAGHKFATFCFPMQIEAEELIWVLDSIPVGNDDGEQQRNAAEFESWCEKTLHFILRDGFDPVEIHPNENAFRRRDVVATSLKKTNFGERIWSNYGVQHLIFEVKNKREIEKSDIVQTSDYLTAGYGRLGFVIYRSDALTLDPVGGWRFREILKAHNKVIIELTTGMLCAMLRRFATRNGPLFDTSLCKLLNDYEHKHWNEPRPIHSGRLNPFN